MSVHDFLVSSHKEMSSGGFTSYTAPSMVEKSMVMTRLGGTYCLRKRMAQKEEREMEERKRDRQKEGTYQQKQTS